VADDREGIGVEGQESSRSCSQCDYLAAVICQSVGAPPMSMSMSLER